MPIKDAGAMPHGSYTDSIGQPYASNNELSAHNDSEDLEEISELFNIIDQGNTSAENGIVSTSSMTTVEKSRPLSVSMSSPLSISMPAFFLYVCPPSLLKYAPPSLLKYVPPSFCKYALP